MRVILAIILAFSTSIGFAQINLGRVSYDVQLSSDDPDMASQLKMISESSMDMYFMEGKIRTDLKIGDMATTITILDKNEDFSLVLMDNMFMGKTAMKAPKEASEETQEFSNQFEVTEVQFIEGETKKIAGYECKKAIVYLGDESESVVWYTEDIVPDYRTGQFLFEEIPGLPLEMSSSIFGLNMQLNAYEVKKKLSKKEKSNFFSMEIPKGYREMTPEDLKKMGR